MLFFKLPYNLDNDQSWFVPMISMQVETAYHLYASGYDF
jgi:hypothetical protein